MRARLWQQQEANLSSEGHVQPVLANSESSHHPDAESTQPKRPPVARRFHLARSNVTLASSKPLGGIRKHKTHNRSHLATFVERHVDRLGDGELQSSHDTSAIDRLIGDANFSPQPRSVLNGSATMVDYSPTRVQSFVKAPGDLAKTGHSIKDHPSTWDHDSDQLADELAAFALEIGREDEVGKREQQQSDMPRRQTPAIAAPDMAMDDMYVYETYLRVSRSELSQPHQGKTNSIGMLVIDEEDEELWQTFAEDGDDSEWDEEDADSNGMSPAQVGVDF